RAARFAANASTGASAARIWPAALAAPCFPASKPWAGPGATAQAAPCCLPPRGSNISIPPFRRAGIDRPALLLPFQCKKELPMPLRRLGQTSISIEPLVLGGNVFGWTLDEAQSFAVLDAYAGEGFTM